MLYRVVHVIYVLPVQYKAQFLLSIHDYFFPSSIIARNQIVSILQVLWEKGTENSQRAYAWEFFLLACLALLTCYYTAASPIGNSLQISTVGYNISLLTAIAEIPSMALWRGHHFFIDYPFENMVQAHFNFPMTRRAQTVTLNKTQG